MLSPLQGRAESVTPAAIKASDGQNPDPRDDRWWAQKSARLPPKKPWFSPCSWRHHTAAQPSCCQEAQPNVLGSALTLRARLSPCWSADRADAGVKVAGAAHSQVVEAVTDKDMTLCGHEGHLGCREKPTRPATRWWRQSWNPEATEGKDGWKRRGRWCWNGSSDPRMRKRPFRVGNSALLDNSRLKEARERKRKDHTVEHDEPQTVGHC